jgi:enterochelin esterase-like enzyme
MKLNRFIALSILFILPTCTGSYSQLNISTCEETGTIGRDNVPDPTQGFNISFQYYLPPCYDKQAYVHFPVIYLITMPFESRLGIDDSTPMSLSERLIHDEKMSPTIIIIPKDTVAQGYHAALAIDLVPYVDKKFHTIKDRRYRGVGGISHGGGIAARMAFQFPNTFGSLGILSGGIAHQEKETFADWIALASVDNLPRVRIDVGNRDGILPLTQNLTSVLDHGQVPYTLNVGEGDHNWTFWSPRMESYLLWFAQAWE